MGGTDNQQNPLALATQAASDASSAIIRALDSGSAAAVMLPSRIVQTQRNSVFLRDLKNGYERLVEEGKVEKEYSKSEQGTACLQELLAALEQPPVDQVRFNAMKAVFLAAATQTISKVDDILPQLILRTVAALEPGEIVLLGVTFEIAERGEYKTGREIGGVQQWCQYIVSKSNFKATAIVEYYEEKLMEKKLLSGRTHTDRSGISVGQQFRLTDFAVELCKFLKAGQELTTKA